MLNTRGWAGAIVVFAVVAIVSGGSGVAQAAPIVSPDSGPVGGGTSVSLPVPPGVAFDDLSAGESYSFAFASADEDIAFSWGGNNLGELGNGTNAGTGIPALVPSVDGVTFSEVSSGSFHTVAVGSDGRGYSWGDNQYGQLGDGTEVARNGPVLISLPGDVEFAQVSAGRSYSLALGKDGNLYAWGNNDFGQFGDGSTGTASSSPVLVPPISGDVTFVEISAGNTHSVARGSDGNVYAWGSNNFGELGIGPRPGFPSIPAPASPRPALVELPLDVTFLEISAGYFHTVARGSDGRAYAWGSNLSGQLGVLGFGNFSPVEVNLPSGVTITSVDAGNYHSAALGEDGNAYSWGQALYGQLGNGGNSENDRDRPVVAIRPAGVAFTKLSSRYDHALALGSDGNTYAWGRNDSGQLGDGTRENSNRPVLVLPPPRVVTEVTFGGVPGEITGQHDDGTVVVETPPHTAGIVDVVVRWTLGGGVQSPVVHRDAFTFIDPPSGSVRISKVVVGDAPVDAVYTFVVTCDGVELSGQTKAGTSVTISNVPAGVACGVKETEDRDALATAYSTELVEVSAGGVANVTVTNTFASSQTSTPPVTPGQGGGGVLSATGGDSTPLVWGTIAAILAVGVGGVLLTVTRVKKRHQNP